jgi:hypothetical protein
MEDPFDVRRDETGWTVFDLSTGAPALVNGKLQQGLPFKFADEMADALNELVRACPPQRH